MIARGGMRVREGCPLAPVKNVPSDEWHCRTGHCIGVSEPSVDAVRRLIVIYRRTRIGLGYQSVLGY